MSEEGIEIKEIVTPKDAVMTESPQDDTREKELHDMASIMARGNKKPMAVIARDGGFEIKPATKDVLKAARQTPPSRFEPPVKPLIASEPTLETTGGKSQGKPWSNHVSKHGIPGGPGRYRKG